MVERLVVLKAVKSGEQKVADWVGKLVDGLEVSKAVSTAAQSVVSMVDRTAEQRVAKTAALLAV